MPLGGSLRFHLRTLARAPGFTAVAVCTLALGIGATTAVFSVVKGALLASLPYKDPVKLVMIWEKNPRFPDRQNVVAAANFLDWRAAAQSFEQLAAISNGNTNLTGEGDPESIPVSLGTSNLFPLLGTPLAAGRGLTEADGAPEAPRAVVISHSLWQRKLAATPEILGRKLILNNVPHEVAGVLPPDVRPLGLNSEIWGVLNFDPGYDYRRRSGRYLLAVGRLRGDVTLEAAHAEMTGIAQRLSDDHPDFNKDWSVTLVPIREQLSQEFRPALLTLLAAAGLLLLIACANAANLLLARASGRMQELAVRASLGASRTRVAGLLLGEALVLAVAGGAAGCLLAVWGVDALLAFAPEQLARLKDVQLDLGVLGFAVAVSLVTALAAGLTPAWRASRGSVAAALHKAGRGGIGAMSDRRLRSAFVVVQVALAVILLSGSGLMIRSFQKLLAEHPGFRADGLLTMRVQLPGQIYSSDERRIAFFAEATERLRALPGVTSGSAIAFLPFTGLASATTFEIEGRPTPANRFDWTCEARVVQPGYFATMGIPLRVGRDFERRDWTGTRKVFLVNETFARKHFGNENPLGKRIVVHMAAPEFGEIVGVVGDTKHYGLDTQVREMAYFPHSQLAFSFMTFVLRTPGDPLTLAAAARGVIRELDANQPVSEVRPMNAWIDNSVTPRRFRMLLLAVFAGAALLLAAMGIYGVAAWHAVRRTREFGVRMALGADARRILRMMLGESARLAAGGIVVGAVAALVLGRLVESLLYQTSPLDGFTHGAVILLMAAVAVIASLLPAWRASKLEPLAALRHE